MNVLTLLSLFLENAFAYMLQFMQRILLRKMEKFLQDTGNDKTIPVLQKVLSNYRRID